MPHHPGPGGTVISFTTNATHPHLIYTACLKTGMVSNTQYIRHAICTALARDLNLDLDTLLAALPPGRTEQTQKMRRDAQLLPGPKNTDEEVR